MIDQVNDGIEKIVFLLFFFLWRLMEMESADDVEIAEVDVVFRMKDSAPEIVPSAEPILFCGGVLNTFLSHRILHSLDNKLRELFHR